MNIHIIMSILMPILLGLVLSFYSYKLKYILRPENLGFSRILGSINVKRQLCHFKRNIKHENVNIHIITSILIPILLGLVMSFTSYKA